MLLPHQGAKSNNQQHQPCQQTKDDDRNDEVEYIETDEDEQTKWEDTTETDEYLQVTTITHTINIERELIQLVKVNLKSQICPLLT